MLDKNIDFGAIDVMPGIARAPWVTIPETADTFFLDLDCTGHRSNEATGVLLEVAIEYRKDQDDATMRELGRDTLPAGQTRNDEGEAVNSHSIVQSLPEPGHKVRELRLLIHSRNGSFQSAGGSFKFIKSAV